MNEIRLSICISTFNRSRFLDETLKTTIPQLTPEVELAVLDDRSPDDPERVARAHAATCPNMRSLQQNTGAGCDEKYRRFGSLGRGEYMGSFSNDDLLKPGAGAAILEAVAVTPRHPLNLAARLHVRFVLGKGDGVTVCDSEHPTNN